MKVKCIFLFFVCLTYTSFSIASDLDGVSELIKNGKETEAIARINRYIQKYPSDPELLFLRGAALDHFGKTREAKEDFLTLSNKYPKDPIIKNNLGVLYAKLGEYRKARVFFELALKLKTDYKYAKNNLSLIQKQDRVYLTSK
ncbi:tetratricopeptide repeat protein [Candidatus Methylopumilus planktonicus]|uniref:tetratricopeptide repeat protein n=1 Tax=Candidatus Methylopumilus planktonicus TaxID=1581557 RepID=UPI001122BA4A|nr:tetratricopeptide repeat protein [Candidatus Methylopumilus planktonicus]QDD00136.1 tetratricopeptide repeat protein [Candidatus Methylopumilus planktonicus]